MRALALEEIEPEDKTRTEVLGARVIRVHPAAKFIAAFPNGAIEFGFLDGHGRTRPRGLHRPDCGR